MLIAAPARILLCRDPIDFRKSIDGLAAFCERVLAEQPLDGSLYVFINRRKTAVKLLVWTHGGFTMLYKRLEKGRFVWPALDVDRGLISPAALAALMEGLDLSKSKPLRRWNLQNVAGHDRLPG